MSLILLLAACGVWLWTGNYVYALVGLIVAFLIRKLVGSFIFFFLMIGLIGFFGFFLYLKYQETSFWSIVWNLI